MLSSNGVKFGRESYIQNPNLGLSSHPFHPGSKPKSWSYSWVSGVEPPSRSLSCIEGHPGSKKSGLFSRFFIYTIKSTNSWTGISLILSKSRVFSRIVFCCFSAKTLARLILYFSISFGIPSSRRLR